MPGISVRRPVGERCTRQGDEVEEGPGGRGREPRRVGKRLDGLEGVVERRHERVEALERSEDLVADLGLRDEREQDREMRRDPTLDRLPQVAEPPFADDRLRLAGQ